jgi:lipopolysaccharide/colanic/teichoic acid biosynthesis glycosyltransferase
MTMKRQAATGIPRSFEILLAASGLIVSAPVLAVAAALIKINSSGPVLFRQRRVGHEGKDFTLFKLRTMTVAQPGPLITAANDGRITAIGKMLRRTKLDELPGLWNVLRGDMSFVGPRPEVPELVDRDNEQWQEILTVRPGITDPVTLKLRSEEKLLAGVEDKEQFYRKVLQPYKLRGYVAFVRDRSFWTDLSVIGRTLKAVVLPNTSPPPTLEEMALDGRLGGRAL